MVNLRVLVPESTTNYILNPALRYDTTGWTAYGSTITRRMDQARFGIASLKVVTSGLVIREGTYYRVSALTGVSEPITVSAYVRGENGNELVHIRLIDNPAGKEWVSKVSTLRNDRWTRIEVSGFSTGSNDLRLYVETDGTARAVTFYVDGAQMERKAYSTSYCDGNQAGCQWNIVDHGSVSTRSAYTRAGGRWVPLSGPCRGDTDVYTTVVTGLSMPPIALNIQPWALAPGSYLQSSKVEDRSIGITFHLKREGLRLPSNQPDLSKMYELRQQLIDIFKPDRTIGAEPFCLEYDDGERPLRIWVHYDGGLEGSWDVRNQWTGGFMLRLLAVDPFWEEDSQDAKELLFQMTTSAGWPNNAVMMRRNGQWDNMNYGFNDLVSGRQNSIISGKKGEIYVCGSFLLVNNNVIAYDPLKAAPCIASYDGRSWNSISTSGMSAGATINGVYLAPNGDLYVIGTFTQIGGVAANRIAKWNGITWSALGSGISNEVTCITGDNSGNIYVGGFFSSAGGINCYLIARWDGAWHQMGAYSGFSAGGGAHVKCLAFDNNKNILYVGGNFTSTEGASDICSYDPTTNTFSAIGSGLNADVYDLHISPSSGILYAGGGFTASGSTPVLYMAKLNGNIWEPLQGCPGGVLAFGISSDEHIYSVIGTSFIYPYKVLYLWNGSSWVMQDCAFTGSNYPDALHVTSKDELILGWNTYWDITTGQKYSYLNSMTVRASAQVKPVFLISGSGKLIWIENISTKKRLYFNLDVASGEEITIDIANSTIQSNTRGNMIHTLQSGSDFSDFVLLPGENQIGCFMVNDVNGKINIYYPLRHWSVDAVMRPEALT